MAKLNVEFSGSGDKSGATVTIQHEGGQTFYRQFTRHKPGMFSSGHWCATFDGIPSGNYVIAWGPSGQTAYDFTRKLITVFEGGETTEVKI